MALYAVSLRREVHYLVEDFHGGFCPIRRDMIGLGRLDRDGTTLWRASPQRPRRKAVSPARWGEKSRSKAYFAPAWSEYNYRTLKSILELNVNSNDINRNLDCAFKIRQVFFDFFKMKRTVPVMPILAS